MSDIKKGTILSGRYELIEKIGRGGMAEVWGGKDTVLGRNVAVKIMLPQFAMDPEFVTRFRHEAAAAANLQNPYIVNIYDWGHDEDIQYIIMEYIQGQDLKHLIQNKGVLPCKSAAKIGAQVCQALSTAHGQDIIHRDIKPQNIMIQPDGNVKVMDFGISRAKNSTEQKTQMVLGTAQYVSPEQAQGLDLTAASDIYSLGIALYESVTGQLPFDGEDAVSVAIKQVEEDPIPPSHLNRNIDPAFEAIILKAMAKDPSERFLSVQEMFAALESYANGRTDQSSATTQVMNRSAADKTQTAPRAMSGNPRYAAAATAEVPDGEDGKKSNKKKIAIIAGCSAVALAIIVVLVAMFVLPKHVEVPDVAGLNVDQAQSYIEDTDLTVGDIIDVPSADVEEGKVIGTDPEAGTRVEKGSAVDIQVSSGPSQVEVPDLSGMTEDQAKSTLSALGLKGVRDADVFSVDIEEGRIAEQNPSADMSVDAGSTVHYSISAGANTLSVPDLSGMTEDSAMSILKDLGLEGLVGSRQPSDTVPVDCVISQNPASGLKVEMGTQITFTVSTGVATVNMPALLGLSQTAARSTLVNAGLVLGNVSEEYSDEAKGTVIRQSVEEGESVEKGMSIDIVVSRGPDPTNENTNTNNGNSNSINGNSNESVDGLSPQSIEGSISGNGN